MNRLFCFLVLIAFCEGFSNENLKNAVHIFNNLLPKNILRVHCISDEDDLGTHFLSPEETYNISFHDSVFKTIIYCQLWQGNNFKFFKKFLAYRSGGAIVHYGKQNFWFAKEDGIYFTHGQKAPKLEYTWTNVSLLKG
ncbi:hypothetical protein CARUB_v10011776mg [Capsella rubella]|uniref:S-protein homolog n=1 Tax=Capsella rubella TaxID=81985 RepID=R0GKW6_9BRAS|nr:S-protein homolog 9 [Capsella rubella]EOA36587.1 hypothetical protein CARUB_v10011776mg [Capsella rubella]